MYVLHMCVCVIYIIYILYITHNIYIIYIRSIYIYIMDRQKKRWLALSTSISALKRMSFMCVLRGAWPLPNRTGH